METLKKGKGPEHYLSWSHGGTAAENLYAGLMDGVNQKHLMKA